MMVLVIITSFHVLKRACEVVTMSPEPGARVNSFGAVAEKTFLT